MAVAGYEVRVNGGTPIDVGNVLQYLVGALTPDTMYDFEVRSYSDTGAYSEWTAVVSATTKDYVLDAITAVPLVPVSFRKLSAAYGGAAIRVRRPSDNTETDLAPNFTKATADAFGANLQVRRWYYQDGSGNYIESVGTSHPKLYFGPRPMVDFGDQDQDMEFRSSNTISVTSPKMFMVVDPVYGTTHLASFGAGVVFDTRFEDGVSNDSFRQDNGSDVTYDNDVGDSGRKAERGYVQVTSWFESGTGDSIRVDGAAIAKVSGTNAGDTAATTLNLVLGNRFDGGFEGSLGKYGEFLLFDGTVSTTDRDAIELSQKNYFTLRGRLVFHGDSLPYGALLDGPTRERINLSHYTRELKGEGWDCYNRSYSGSSFSNVTPLANLITQGPLQIDPLFRTNALNNILIIWAGWNDMQNDAGDSAATFQTNLQTYCEARQAAGWTVIVVSVPLANYAGQGAGYAAKRLAVNAWLTDNWFNFANGYADISVDPIIGDAGATTDTTYWIDELHMTSAGYEIVAGYIEGAIAAMADVTPPSVPTSFAAGTPDVNEIPFTWAVSTGSPVAYQIRKATDSAFTLNVSDTNIAGGATTSGDVTGLAAGTLYYFKIRARDAQGNWSAYSAAISATTDVVTPISPDSLGADCVFFLDAEDHVGLSDGAAVTAFTNLGSGPDYTGAAGVTKQTDGADTVIRHAGGGSYIQANSNQTGTAAHTFYALAKPTSTTADEMFLGMPSVGSGFAIILGYVDGKWEYYSTPRTQIADIDTANFQLVKNVVGATNTSQWIISSDFTGDWKAVCVFNRALTSGEEAGIEAWFALRM